jgi:hypothetical protein
VVGFIHNQTSEKGLARHNYSSSWLEEERPFRWMTELSDVNTKYICVSFMGLGLYFT